MSRNWKVTTVASSLTLASRLLLDEKQGEIRSMRPSLFLRGCRLNLWIFCRASGDDLSRRSCHARVLVGRIQWLQGAPRAFPSGVNSFRNCRSQPVRPIMCGTVRRGGNGGKAADCVTIHLRNCVKATPDFAGHGERDQRTSPLN